MRYLNTMQMLTEQIDLRDIVMLTVREPLGYHRSFAGKGRACNVLMLYNIGQRRYTVPGSSTQFTLHEHDILYVPQYAEYCFDITECGGQSCDYAFALNFLMTDVNGEPVCFGKEPRIRPYHIFHDNLVSHEEEVSRTRNDEDYQPYSCRRVLAKPENRYLLLAGNFVRPEDICRYEGIVDGVKLATRVHFSPVTVIGAYVRGRFPGDLCSLTEPGFGKMLEPYYLDNAAVPEDFFEKTSSCSRDCAACGYCQTVFDRIKRRS